MYINMNIYLFNQDINKLTSITKTSTKSNAMVN